MRPDERPVMFEDRQEAGRRLARHIERSGIFGDVVLGIARGGVPVAAAVAHRLHIPWAVVASKRLPIPWYPQVSIGAITSDGAKAINQEMLDSLAIGQSEVDNIARSAMADAIKEAAHYSSTYPQADLQDKTVLVVDDVLISGYTMLAAIQSARIQGAAQVIAASPVSSRSAAALVEASADESVFEIVSPSVPFSPDDFYLQWPEMDVEDVLNCMVVRKG